MRAVAAAVAASLVTAAAATTLTLWFTSCNSSSPKSKHKPKGWSQEIVDEQQARTRAFLGDAGLSQLRKSSVVIVGAGGVGSWVATMLVRSGVGRVRIVDFDQVTLSTLNRHACATLEDVGTSKVTCLANYLRKVAPWVIVEPVNDLWTKEKAHLVDGFEFVVDCIDNIHTKVDLLEYCHRNRLPVIASMGAGTKADPTRVNIGDISSTIEDPLSRVVRVKLRARGIMDNIPTVYSTEKPAPEKARLLKLDDSEIEKGAVEELGVLQDFRVRVLPVLGPLPGLFGLTIATHLLTYLGGYHSVYDPLFGGYSFAPKNQHKLYENMLRSIIGQFARMRWDEEHTMPITREEIQFLMEEVWRGHTLSGGSNRPKLTIWDPTKTRDISNVVPVSSQQQKRHEELILKGGRPLDEVYSPEELEQVYRRQQLNNWYRQLN